MELTIVKLAVAEDVECDDPLARRGLAPVEGPCDASSYTTGAIIAVHGGHP